jgi:hypothetical protein
MVSGWKFVFRRFEISSSWIYLFSLRAFGTFVSTSLPVYSLFAGWPLFLLTKEFLATESWRCNPKLWCPWLQKLATVFSISDQRPCIRRTAHSLFWHLLVFVERNMWAFCVPCCQMSPCILTVVGVQGNHIKSTKKSTEKNGLPVPADKLPWTLQTLSYLYHS